MNMIIEAGGTKSNIVFTEKGKIIDSYTEAGFNLSQENPIEFEKRLISWSGLNSAKVETVFLFAAGKVNIEKEKEFSSLIRRILRSENAFIYSDLLAACYATAGNSPGIVGILGTGSNSCYYNGAEIEKNISPGGFILGDEGSGAYIGKKILIDYLRNHLSPLLKKELENEFHLTNDLIIQNVYGGTVRTAAIFCSSFAAFATKRLDDPYCNSICEVSIDEFLAMIAKNYLDHSNQLFLVGSVAFHLSEMIKLRAQRKNIEIIKIIQHPIQDLSLFLSAR